MATRVDDLLVLKEYLEQNATLHNETASETLYDEVGTNVWVDQIPKSYDKTGGVMIERAGGPPDPDVPVLNPIVQFRCLGTTWIQAERIAAALHDRLHGINMVATASGTIMSAIEVVPPQQLDIEDTETKRVIVRYACEIRNT